MNISGILRGKLCCTEVAIVQKATREVSTFHMVQHIGPQSVFLSTQCAFMQVVLSPLDVLQQDVPCLLS